MKILLIDNSLDETGASKALLQTVEGISDSSFEFIFLFPRNSKCVAITNSKGYQAFELRFFELSKRGKDLFIYFPLLFLNGLKLRKFVRKNNIAIIHVNDIYNMMGIVAKIFSGVKLVTHIRRMPESFPTCVYKTWVKLHLKYADQIIAVSEANKRRVIPNKKTTVIYDPLPDAEIESSYIPRAYLQKKIKVLYLANYTRGKGHLYALQILRRAIKDYPDWQFYFSFYGGDFDMQKNAEYKQSLVNFSGYNSLDAFVKFNGKTERVEHVMKSHDLILNLSDSESFSRITLEALFYGVPIIATDVGGTSEMIIHEKTGLLAPAFNVDEMYKAFCTIINDDAFRTKMAAEGYYFVRSEFSRDKTVTKLANLYQIINDPISV